MRRLPRRIIGRRMLPTHTPEHDPETTLDRKSKILASAGRAFSASGFKGSSLREIAADAEVSLTLVNHHFGSKEQLLVAVIGRHHDHCNQRMAGFRSALFVDGFAASLAQLTGVWVRHEFDLLVSNGGTDCLRLLVKLMNDDNIGVGIRQRLDCSEPVVLHALALAASGTRKSEIRRTFILARGALHAALTAFAWERETGLADDVDLVVDSAAAFIHSGLAASLS